MTIKIYEQRVLIPDSGKYLYNKDEKIISIKVFLAVGADEKEWQEITAEEKEQLEAQWEVENNLLLQGDDT